VVGLVWIVVRGIIEVWEQQKAIQFSASLIGKDKQEDKDYIFVNDDESEELNAMMAEEDQEEEEFLW